MRFGVLTSEDGPDGGTLDALIGQVRAAADAGFDIAYTTQFFSWDGITLAALSAREVPGIEVGMAVTQTYPRHPLALASQALTAQAASGNRFVLGIGPSHQWLIEGTFGYSYDRPAAHTREYLSVLRPLLHGEEVDHHGEHLTAVGRVSVPGATPPPVLLAALGPVMLRIAGELADGTMTVWTGPRLIAEHIAPSITRAADEAGRPAPRVVASVIASLTDDPDGLRERIGKRFGAAGQMPAYRAVLDRQGASAPEETVIAGDERTLEQAVRAYADAGTTELVVTPYGTEPEKARTLEFLSTLSGGRGRTSGRPGARW